MRPLALMGVPHPRLAGRTAWWVLPRAVLVAAVVAACDAPSPGGGAVVTALIVDSTGRPVPGAHGSLRPLYGTGPQVAADAAGRVRLEAEAGGPGVAEFGPGGDTPWTDRVTVPLLLEPGEVELRVRLGGDSAGAVYPDPGPRMARWGRAVALGRELEARYYGAYEAWVQAGQKEELSPELAPVVDSVRTLLRREEDPEVRGALWAALLRAGAFGVDITADTASLILDELSPGAKVWATDPLGAAGLIQYAADRAERVDAAADAGGEVVAGREKLANRRAMTYLDRIIEAHPDPAVAPRLLLGALRLASVTGRRDDATRYYERIVRSYPGSGEAELAADMAPGSRPGVGDPVPDVSFPALDSTAPDITAAELAGPATLVDFWAVWCTPCVAEIPNLRAAYERFADRGFRIVSVSFDNTREDVRRFRAAHPMPWEHAFVGAQGLSGGAVAEAYGITGLPDAVLVGPHGTILAAELELRGERLAETLERLLPAE